jgi:hypothetical protein
MQLLIAWRVARGPQPLDVPAHGVPTSRFRCLRRQLLPVMTGVDLIELQVVCQPQRPRKGCSMATSPPPIYPLAPDSKPGWR